MSFDDFLHTINNPDFNFGVTNKHCLYIFYDMVWSDVVINFKDKLGVTISGDSNVKRHLLSPLRTKLFSYIIVMFNLNFL